ncbi:MAG TPA: N-formylglutamate deformylase [Steroidobacteraceae bacterium]|jgi:N-formylglutamate deformylase|nr:N-formylglutamate deformylase [Steroidobacteraceae bacterium]
MAESARVPIFGCEAGASPLLISFPHSGTYIPHDIAARLEPAALDLPDTDWFVPELYHFAREAGASVIRATHTRYVVDLNRPPDGKPLYPGQRETTVCPVETFDGEALYKPGEVPGAAEIAARLGMYWRPYHDQLAALTREIAARHGHCILYDAHSIRSEIPGLFEGRLPDLNVGTSSGKSCSPAILERVVAPLKAQSRFSVVVDGRFKGGYITRHYGNPAARIEAVQMEIAQCAYIDEQRVPAYDRERARPLSMLLQEIIASLARGC